MTYLLRSVACLFVLFSFNTKALVINGCTIEPFTTCIGADLSGANLTNAYLPEADLTGAYLTGALLYDANLGLADLSGADLTNANLGHANLYIADLSDADLTGALLYNANLTGANLTGADLSSANLTNANLSMTDMSYTDLTDARYNDQTVFTLGFDPVAEGMIFSSEVPLPAAFWLFASGLISLRLFKR